MACGCNGNKVARKEAVKVTSIGGSKYRPKPSVNLASKPLVPNAVVTSKYRIKKKIVR